MRPQSMDPLIRQYLTQLSGGGYVSTRVADKYLNDPEFHALLHMAVTREVYLEFSPVAEERIQELQAHIKGLEAEISILHRELDDWVTLERRQRDALVSELARNGG